MISGSFDSVVPSLYFWLFEIPKGWLTYRDTQNTQTRQMIEKIYQLAGVNNVVSFVI